MNELIYRFPFNFIVGIFIFFALSFIISLLSVHLRSKISPLKKNMDYEQLKREMIDALRRSIEEQNAGRIRLIEVGYDNLDHAVPRNDGPEFDKLINALYFWDCWINLSNHEWLYHGDLQTR